MTSSPTAKVIPRRGRGVKPADQTDPLPPADWTDVTAVLRQGEAGPFWLSVTRDDTAPHVRPVFAAWAQQSFFFASKDSAAKTRHLEHHPDATISADLGQLHLVVEGRVSRVADPATMQLASQTMQDVFSWPTEVSGDQLDADYGAPTSGGPPYRVYEFVPTKAYAFPTEDQVEPTRWAFDS